jgi:hypothetical protein
VDVRHKEESRQDEQTRAAVQRYRSRRDRPGAHRDQGLESFCRRSILCKRCQRSKKNPLGRKYSPPDWVLSDMNDLDDLAHTLKGGFHLTILISMRIVAPKTAAVQGAMHRPAKIAPRPDQPLQLSTLLAPTAATATPAMYDTSE